MSDLPLFDSHEELRQMLFASLESEGFKCVMGIPIHENQYGQTYRHHNYMVPIEDIPTKSDAIKIFHNIAAANFTATIFDPCSPAVSKFDFTEAIEFRSIELCRHGENFAWFYMRGISRNESGKIKWQYDSEGKIERAENESTKQDN